MSYSIRCVVVFMTLLLSIVGALTLIEQDPAAQAYTMLFVRNLLENALKVPLSLRIEKVRILEGLIRLRDLRAADPAGNWRWSIDTLDLHFSLRTLIQQRLFSLSCSLYGVDASSEVVQGTVAILPHILQLLTMTNAAQQLVVERVLLKSGLLRVQKDAWQTVCAVRGDIPVAGGASMLRLWWDEGVVRQADQVVIAGCTGSYSYDQKLGKTTVQAALRCLLQPVADQPLMLQLTDHKGRMQITAAHGPSNVQGAVTIDRPADTVQGAVTAPLAYLLRCVPVPSLQIAGGTTTVAITGHWKQLFNDLGIQLTVQNLAWRALQVDELQAAIRLQDLHRGTLSADLKGGPLDGMHVAVTGQAGGEWRIGVSPLRDFCLPLGLTVPAKQAEVQVQYAQGTYQGTYSLPIRRGVQELARFEGTLRGDQHAAQVSGLCNGYRAALSVAVSPQFRLHTFELCEGEKCVATCKMGAAAHATPAMVGSIEYALVARVADAFGLHLPGEGSVHFTNACSSEGITSTLSLEAGSIRLPYLYNVVEGCSFKVTVPFSLRSVTVEDLKLKLHKGLISSSRVTAQLAPDKTVSFLHAPVCFEDCFVSWGKELFASFSGTGAVTFQESGERRVVGTLWLDRSHIRDNIFSAEFQRTFRAAPGRPFGAGAEWLFDLHLLTRQPLQVKSSFLEGSAHLGAHITGSSSLPQVRATIDRIQGSLLFPYKPLFIQQGTVTMLPEYGDDPVIELQASNTIKGYRIRLNLSGSARAPRISFDSVPHLPEEQIIGLLWGGSEDGSLYLAMSASIMQSLEQLLVGPSESMPRLLQSLKNIFKPLGSVRFVPSFTDLSARGGLRGALAIEVNDRLRGIIKQNFDLPQDVMLEVEYALSDEARVRAFKDERGDVGAEVEASWKF